MSSSTRVRGSRSGRRRKRYSKRKRLLSRLGIGFFLTMLASGVFYFFYPAQKAVEVNLPWSGQSASLVFDHHTHTRFSDGALTTGELVALAHDNGCNALVVSDHSDVARASIQEQVGVVEQLRSQYPDMFLFGGIELNMPSYGGREHAGVIASPSVDVEILQQIRDVAEQSTIRADVPELRRKSDDQLLQLIADHQSLYGGLMLVYSHPSRKDPDLAENLADILRWNARYPVFSMLEGGPGHQNDSVIGSYQGPHLTEDHWDPVVAEVGGAWDQLWSQGKQIWGALATSDYHNAELDKAPCAFSRTHLIVPERSYRGVLKALKMGTFWADHGRILEQLWFSADVDGLENSAYPGSTVYVGDQSSVAVVSLSVERGPGSEGQPLTVEFIGNCKSGEPEILAEQALSPADSTVSTLVPLAATGLDGESCSLRARVRLNRGTEPDYLAYTNPIRFTLD